MPGGYKAGVHAALRSLRATKCAKPASDTPAAPVVAALQGTRRDRAACCLVITQLRFSRLKRE